MLLKLLCYISVESALQAIPLFGDVLKYYRLFHGSLALTVILGLKKPADPAQFKFHNSIDEWSLR